MMHILLSRPFLPLELIFLYFLAGFFTIRTLARRLPHDCDTGGIFIFFTLIWPVVFFLLIGAMVCSALDGYVKKQNKFQRTRQREKRTNITAG